MKDSYFIAREIIKRFREKKIAQVEGYYKFKYVSETAESVTVLREKGTKARIPFSKLKIGVEAVMKDDSVYNLGPDSLREFGITHINSPIWAMLHLLEKEEYKDN